VRKSVITGAVVAMLVGAVVATAHAQPYPTRTIKIVVPATPGGAIDTIARLVGEKLTVSMGQPVVVQKSARTANNPRTMAGRHEVMLCCSGSGDHEGEEQD
jgi:hypothetical protein